jgi:hypothetical protein
MEFINEINEMVGKNTNFKVNRIPIEVLNDFKFFCKQECGDVYWVGIKQLLNTKILFNQIVPTLLDLKNQVDELKNQLNKKVVKEEPRTFSK